MARTGDTILVHFVEEKPVGLEFERRRTSWPLHITQIVWFRLPVENQWMVLDRAIGPVTAETEPILAAIGPVEYFGARKDVPVNTIKNQQPFKRMHTRLKSNLDSIGAQYQSESFSGDAYRAHITQHGEEKMREGDELLIDRLYLVQLQPRNICRVVKSYKFGYNMYHG